MRRYSKDPYCRCGMEPSDSGAWVMFDDIAPPAGWEDDLDATLRVRQAEIEKLRAALLVAVRQNDHDMLMTGDELRACRAALMGLWA